MSRPEGVLEMMPTSTVEEDVFIRYLRRVRPLINEQILTEISRPPCQGWMGANLHQLFAKGKRLRGALLMLSFTIFSDDDLRAKDALELAAAIEIAHTTSIILDDMIDGDDRRRGQNAIHLDEGQRQAVLGMVGALSIPYSITAHHGKMYTEHLAATHRTMVAGEMAELRPVEDDGVRKKYEEVITQKTGQLFSLAARFGGMAAGCEPEAVELLSSFGGSVGKVVQQADDIHDLNGIDERTALHGSEMLLARLIRGTEGEGVDIGEEALALLDERIAEAVSIADRLGASGGCRTVDEKLVAGLRSAPREMAMMMLESGGPRRNVMFGGPLKRPK